MAALREKIGYGFGDMASSMFWKIFSYYLPFFYAHVFGLTVRQAAMLFLVTRIWDAVSDPLMGIVADRTVSRWGKYRPYLLWAALPFSLCGVLLFSTPSFGPDGKLIYAYATYLLMMTVYTVINVPYGAMLGVITTDSNEKTLFSSFRMFFAYGGSFLALACWEPLCSFFESRWHVASTTSWQWAMIVVAVGCFICFLLCFLMTREKVKTRNTASVGADFKALLRNKPWWMLIGAALSNNLFNTIRGSAVAFYFADVIGGHASLSFFAWKFAFFAGLFLSVGEIANMLGVALATYVTRRIGKKHTFIGVEVALILFSIAFFYLPCTQGGYWGMLMLQVGISVGTGIVSPLIWSMYADVSDYAEWKYRTASTGLIFSSASMAQKFGSAFGGSGTLWILGAFGYVTVTGNAGLAQTPYALDGLRYLMSFIPAMIAAAGLLTISFYPLTTERMRRIDAQLHLQRVRQNGR